jgi:D-beta-D-heptose 7-phosphate kinase/D-beta-D-heptose 1-phosphate adenosyltransferase
VSLPTIALTSGCFDGGLHAGHRYFLREMSMLADVVIVAVNSDEYIWRVKNRAPICAAVDRRRHIMETGFVDMCLIYDDDGPMDLVMRFRPDVIVAGSDYTANQVVGGKECAEWGGRVVIIPRIPGISTTEILRMRERQS